MDGHEVHPVLEGLGLVLLQPRERAALGHGRVQLTGEGAVEAALLGLRIRSIGPVIAEHLKGGHGFDVERVQLLVEGCCGECTDQAGAGS